MKISKISRDASLEISRIVFCKFLSKAYSQSCLANFFFLTLKTTFFLFSKISRPRTTRPTAFYRSSKFCRRYRGSIMRKTARIYESNIRRTHGSLSKEQSLSYGGSPILVRLSLSLSLSLCFFCSPFFLIKLHTPVSCRWTRKKKRKGKNETRRVIHHHHHPHSSGIYTELSCKSFHL